MHPSAFENKTVNEIISINNVRLIAFRNRGKGSPITNIFKPDWDSNKMIQSVFTSNAKAKELSLSATEVTLAEYFIVTKNGGLFILEVLGDHIQNVPITAVLLRGEGFGCRFDI